MSLYVIVLYACIKINLMCVIKLLCLLFTAHSYGIFVCVFVSPCQFVHVQISIVDGMLTNHALCENVGMYSAYVCMHVHVVYLTPCWLFTYNSLLLE